MMTASQFLQAREPAWRQLEALLDRAAGRAGRLDGQELHELTRLYPAVAADVARARLLGLDAARQRRVNDLALRAHGILYRHRRVRPAQRVRQFFLRDYPRLFRRLRGYFALTTAIFLLAALATYATVRVRPSVAYVFVPHGLDVGGTDDAVTADDVSERYRQMPQGIMASAITTNNIQVAFLAFALGIFAGIGTCYVLLVNGMMLGAFFGHFANHGLTYEVWEFLTPHGALEIFAILVAGTAGLRMGLALAVPGSRTRGASLRHGAREALLLLLGTLPMFIVAGAVESFITPSYLPGEIKIAIGVSLLGLTLAYLVVGGRRGQAA